MAHYCSQCSINEVAHEGDICPTCAGNVPQPTGNSSSNTFPQYTPSPHVNRYGYNSNASSTPAPPPPTGVGYTTQAQPNPPAQQQAAPKMSKRTSLTGIVQNLVVTNDGRPFLARIMDSVFKGIEYNGGSNLQKMEFQLFQSWNASGGLGGNQQVTATNVICYGNIKHCSPADGNDVRVEGVWDRESGSLIADKIQITTSGAYTVFYPPKTSASLIRFIMIFILLLIAAAVGFVITSVKSPSGGVRSGIPFSQILVGLALILIGVALFVGATSARRGMRSGKRMLMYSISVFLIVAGFAVFSLEDAGTKMQSLWPLLVEAVVYPGLFKVGFSLLLGAGHHGQVPHSVDKLLTWVAIFGGVLIFVAGSLQVLFA